jgi:hypothetical protein
MNNDSYGFFGGGSAYFGFPTLGTSITGTIAEEPETRQQTDPSTGDLKTFKNGDPMTVLVVTLQTDLRDPQVMDDDGKRSVWLSSKGQKQAVGKALRDAKSKGLDVGGTLSMAYTADGEKSNPAFSAPKIFSAHYVPPANVSESYFAAETNAAPVAQAPVAAPVAAVAPAPVAAAPVNLPPGMTPEVWNGLTPEARTALSALAGG